MNEPRSLKRSDRINLWLTFLCRAAILVLLYFNLSEPGRVIGFQHLMITFIFAFCMGSLGGYFYHQAYRKEQDETKNATD